MIVKLWGVVRFLFDFIKVFKFIMVIELNSKIMMLFIIGIGIVCKFVFIFVINVSIIVMIVV